jgi:1-acyl-sn-glycerol-3-phosphate acyltransferase
VSRRYRLFRWVVVALGRLLFGFRVEGVSKVVSGGPLIVASNHRRLLDPVLVCMAVPRRLQWMAKKELFVSPFDRFFHFLGAFPVDRKGGARSALRASLVYLEEGRALGIFPEGTRRKGGVDLEAKNGAAMLAVRSGAPVLPVYVGEAPSLAARLKGERLCVRIGDPLVLDGGARGREAYRREVGRVLCEIYALSGEREGRT